MSETTNTSIPKPLRRKLVLKSANDVRAEVQRLRKSPLRQAGSWTFPQACRHLATVIEGSLTPPESTVPTPEESAKREGFFAMAFAPGGFPENLPLSPSAVPPPDCNDADIDRLLAAFDKLQAYPHTHVKVGGCGPVPIADVVRLHIIHAQHHLSFQVPIVQPRVDLRYPDEAAAIADVTLLRRGYTQAGNWSLPQMCWHITKSLQGRMGQPDGPVEPATAQQQEMLRSVLSTGTIPSGLNAPPHMTPPSDAGDADINAYVQLLTQLQNYEGPWGPHRIFGQMSAAHARKHNLAHAAHHFANLVPNTM